MSGNLPIRKELHNTTGLKVVRAFPDHRAHQMIATHSTITVFQNPRGPKRIWRDNKGRIRSDEIEFFAFNRFKKGSLANIQFDTVKRSVEARDLTRSRRQVGRNNASSVCGQIQGLDSASTPQVQGGFDKSSKCCLQERGRCAADSQNVVWANGFTRHVFTQVR